MAASITPVILSGGAGTRLWPLSRQSKPKQFLMLAGDQNFIAMTASRVADSNLFQSPLVICSEAHRFLVAESLRQADIVPRSLVLEPVGRNTAAAAVIAALILASEQPESLMLLLPSDHMIRAPQDFLRAVAAARPAAEGGRLVTFGMTPTAPATGYGYIAYRPEESGAAGWPGVYPVHQFVEKPDQATAQSYLDAGNYVWNSGMFLMRADQLLAECQRLAPEILEHAAASLASGAIERDFIRLDNDKFSALPNLALDVAIMEKTNLASVVPAEFGWSDVGSWDSLWQISDQDPQGNVVKGDVLHKACAHNYLHSEGQLLAAIGLENMVVVATGDAVLVAARDQVQDVKWIVDQLRQHQRHEADNHAVMYRPWGSYETLALVDRYQVKRIMVQPGQKLSLQKHHHRAEHWVVVSGTAKVTRDDQEIMLYENQSVYLPQGAVHRLENPGKIPTVLIEVQCGGYLGEDDIIRLEDIYHRAGS
ncbi:MAG: mannose-1-phosphate guanylyltransferase/mannose-6-phosphate isomerase [Candidatus Symbiobacter sp.]|nr:mannose-1-phosphate guanylyltransferase/mannose-6-phosphate isomerase [Candidatus Symbiobacter sp.]